MRTFYLPAADPHRRDHNLLRRQAIQQQTHRRHIRDGVHRPHLVKMNLAHRDTMYMALRLRDQGIDREDVPADFLRHRQASDNFFDPVQAAVVVVFLFFVCGQVLRFFLSVHLHCDERPPDAASGHRFTGIDNARYAESVQLFQECFPVRKKLQKRCRQHIARSAHAAVQIKCSHLLLRPFHNREVPGRDRQHFSCCHLSAGQQLLPA